MSTKLQGLMGLVVTSCPVAIATPSSGQVWVKLNDGNPVDADVLG